MRAPRIAALIRRLARLRPGSRAADQVCNEISKLLMHAILARGSRAPGAIVADLNRRGRRFRLTERVASLRTWTEKLDPDPRVIELVAGTWRPVKTAHVNYRSSTPPRLTKRQSEAQARHEAFYALYLDSGRKAYGSSGVRLTRRETTALLVGELEADVNNGGFGQYLSNKGRRRASAALRRLTTIGARRTARMLRRALELSADSEALEPLDDEFCRRSEDLAGLALRFFEGRRRRAAHDAPSKQPKRRPP